MIIENLQRSDVQTIGDVKTIKTSIDVKNIDFITTLLSTNLYSNPIGSFLREIVSNAWDSHVDAGNIKEPVIIKVTYNNVTIRDYGTGLSQEAFEDMYCKIGSSTKRDSNNFIGGFGIGKFSSIAVSDVVYIKNYYNGFCSSYVMIKENNTITTNQLNIVPTTEHNGLEITVDTIGKTDKILKELLNLTFFPNIYVDYSNVSIPDKANLNSAKIVRYKNFSVSSVLNYINGWSEYNEKSHGIYVLLGNVLYPLETAKLDLSIDGKTLRNLKECNICLNVPIGSINVTPNRESIQYNESTIEFLQNKMKDALKEIDFLINTLNKIDTDDIALYHKYITETSYWNPIENNLVSYWGDAWETAKDVTFKGIHKSTSFDDEIKTIYHNIVPGFKTYYDGDTFYTEKGINWHNRSYCRVSSEDFVAIEGNKNISGYTREYIKYNRGYREKAFINLYDRDRLISEILKLGNHNYIDKSTIPAFAMEVAEEYADRIIKNTTIITQKEIDDYRKDIIDNRPKGYKKVDNTKYILHKWVNGFIDEKINPDPRVFSEIIELIKRQGKCILHRGRDNAPVSEYKTIEALGYKILWCSTILYDKIIAYYYNRTNHKELSGLVLDYKTILENPSQETQVNIVLAKYCNIEFEDDYLTTLVEKIYKLCSSDKDFITFYNKAYDESWTLRDLGKTEFAKNLKLTSPLAIWLDDYIKKLIPIAKEYQKVSYQFKLNNVKNVDLLSQYYIAKWCIRKGIHINYQYYLRVLKNKPLIKLIYEQTY